MTILLLGGRGKTTSRIAPLLHAANLPFLVASRSTSPDSPYKQAHFDWLDETTYGNPLKACAEEGMDPISAVWLVPPPIYEMGPPMNKFVDFARSKGVGRFVLLSATIIEKGGEAMGQVHEYLASLKGIEFVVLRPTWFMENFSAPKELQRLAIKDEDKIYSAAGEGKVPFISTNDIARVAMHALTDRKLQNTEHIIVGPELLSYDQVADILTKILGRKITHARLTESELAKHFQSSGMSAEQAEWEAAMDTGIKKGGEERMNNAVEEITGVPPQRFYDFAEKEKQSWKKDG